MEQYIYHLLNGAVPHTCVTCAVPVTGARHIKDDTGVSGCNNATWVLLSACEQRAALLGGCHCSARFSLSLATMALICQSRGLDFETIHCCRKTHVVSVIF